MARSRWLQKLEHKVGRMAGGRQKIWPKARRAANVMTGVLLLRTKRGGGCGECAGGGTLKEGAGSSPGKLKYAEGD